MADSKVYANYRKRGTYYEQAALKWLEDKGYSIVCKNYRCRIGEIDIIALDGDTLVFIEVKFRSSLKMGYPWEAVGVSKQHRICQCAKWYMASKHISETTSVRFDVISICNSEVIHYKNAFHTR